MGCTRTAHPLCRYIDLTSRWRCAVWRTEAGVQRLHQTVHCMCLLGMQSHSKLAVIRQWQLWPSTHLEPTSCRGYGILFFQYCCRARIAALPENFHHGRYVFVAPLNAINKFEHLGIKSFQSLLANGVSSNGTGLSSYDARNPRGNSSTPCTSTHTEFRKAFGYRCTTSQHSAARFSGINRQSERRKQRRFVRLF
jgi:hypothetical protein